jgi:metal-responsive CopG/Arc/MetJ family transcriptional regulator
MGRKNKYERKNVGISASIRADQDAMLGELNMSRSQAIQHALDLAYGKAIEMNVKISISMPVSMLARIDSMRGDMSRSEFIRNHIE